MKNIILSNTRNIPNFVLETDPEHETWEKQVVDMIMGETYENGGKKCRIYADKNLVPVKQNFNDNNFIINKHRTSSKGTDEMLH